MTIAVLDASALLALLLDEPGGDSVRSILADSAMSDVNLSEVIGHYARNGVAETHIKQVLDPLPIERYPFDTDLAYEAALLLPITKPVGLSFGDRACLALARHLKIKVLTADRSWLAIAKAAEVEIVMIR